MNSGPVQLATLIHSLDLMPSLRDASSRRAFQATVYLAQQLGLNLGYSFQWLQSGPYSSDLTDDLYELASGPNSTLPYPLNETSKKRASTFKKLLSVPNGITLSTEQWLLLLAGTHYLMKYLAGPEVDKSLSLIDADIPEFKNQAAEALAKAA